MGRRQVRTMASRWLQCAEEATIDAAQPAVSAASVQLRCWAPTALRTPPRSTASSEQAQQRPDPHSRRPTRRSRSRARARKPCGNRTTGSSMPAGAAAGRVAGSWPDHYRANFLTRGKAKPAHTPPSDLAAAGFALWTSDAWGRMTCERRHYPGRAYAGSPEFAVPVVGGAGDAASAYHLRRSAGAQPALAATAAAAAAPRAAAGGGGLASGTGAAGPVAGCGGTGCSGSYGLELRRTGAWAAGLDQGTGAGAAAAATGGDPPAYRSTRRHVAQPVHPERPHGRRPLEPNGHRPPHFTGGIVAHRWMGHCTGNLEIHGLND